MKPTLLRYIYTCTGDFKHFLLRTLGSSVYQTAEIKTDTNPVSHGSSFIPQTTRKGQIWNIAWFTWPALSFGTNENQGLQRKISLIRATQQHPTESDKGAWYPQIFLYPVGRRQRRFLSKGQSLYQCIGSSSVTTILFFFFTKFKKIIMILLSVSLCLLNSQWDDKKI